MGDRLSSIRYRTVKLTSPAAGAPFTFTVPGEVFWVLRSLTFQLVTSAAVANRFVVLSLSDADGTYFRSAPNNAQAASLTSRYSAFPGAQHTGLASTELYIPIDSDGLVIETGHALNIGVNAIDVADQLSAIVARVLEFETGPLFAGVPIPPFYVPQLDPAYAG